MSRSRRRRAHHYRHAFDHLPPRFVGNRLIPPEIAVLLPDEAPMRYFTCRAELHDIVRLALRVEPDASHAGLTFDVLGGLHEIRVHDGGASLEAVVAEHAEVLRDFPLPTCVVVAERVAAPASIGPARSRRCR